MVKDKSPTLLFLIETKANKERLQFMRCKMGFEGLFTVDPVGKSGGLALFWRNSKEVDIVNFSLRHINANITMFRTNHPWKLKCFYGHPDWWQRGESWHLLSHLGSLSPHQWLCLGDFNEISNWYEKEGGALRNKGQMASFNAALETCQLRDLGFKGSNFTWRNKRELTSFIKERLDRALATEGWCNDFPEPVVVILPTRTSDHNP
jgi:hypothetical protein